MRRLAAFLAVLALLLFVAPATASTTVSSQEHRILDQINAERAARGLRPLRADIRVWDLAGDRATRMASTGASSLSSAGRSKDRDSQAPFCPAAQTGSRCA